MTLKKEVMEMGTRERIRIIRLIEKARVNPVYAKVLGITTLETKALASKKGV